MLNDVLPSEIVAVFIIPSLIGLGMIIYALLFIDEEIKKEEEGKPVPELSAGTIGLMGFATIIASIIAVLVIHHTRDIQLHKAIIASAENDYNVTIHPRPGQEDNYALPAMDGTPVPVIVEHQGKLYDNAYILTYSSAGNGTVELELNHTITLDDSVPTPEEMKQ